jgi:1-acyl-sn-glycerol-3-phosphate acyltransferase
MVEESQAALAQGRSVLIFPEGTRKSVSEPVAFKRGVELLYAKLGRPVLPVALNSGHFWGPGQPYKRAGTISVCYLDPIPAGLAAREFTHKAEQLLETERRFSWPQAA